MEGFPQTFPLGYPTTEECTPELTLREQLAAGIAVNRVYNLGCLELMAHIPDNFVPLTVCSPPYDSLRTYRGYAFEFEKIARELYRITKQGGVVVWVVGDETKNGNESGT